MAKKVILGLIFLSFTITYLSVDGRGQVNNQNKPNFSGTWKLDRDMSSFTTRAQLKSEDDLILVISHVEPEIKVTRKFIKGGKEQIQDLTYYSDGRGEVNYTFVGRKKGKSKTQWDGNALVSRFTVKDHINGENIDYKVTESWMLSDKGKTLTQIQQFERKKSRLDSLSVAGIPIPALPPRLFLILIVFNRVS